MSVLMMIQLDADPAKFEEVAAANPDKIKGIRDRAVGKGLIAHRFIGKVDGGEVMVVDEWETAEQFQTFFAEVAEDVGSLMQEVGVTNQPQPEFWRVLESHDKYGWES
jgi:heme-degrading monooxygenase HmoA